MVIMKTATYLQNLDKTINHLNMNVIGITLKDLKSLRKHAQTTDLGGNNELIKNRLDDLIGLTSDAIRDARQKSYINAHLSKSQVEQFKQDLVNQIKIIYWATNDPAFDYSTFLSGCRSCWMRGFDS